MCRKPTCPQFPEEKVDEAPRKHPIFRKMGTRSIPSQSAANFFAKTKFDDEATEPPASRRSAPKLRREPWSLQGAEFRGPAGYGVARQEKFRAKRPCPSSARIFFAQVGFVAAGALAGARDSFGVVGAEWTNLAQIAAGGLTRSQNRPRVCLRRKIQIGVSLPATSAIFRRRRACNRGHRFSAQCWGAQVWAQN